MTTENSLILLGLSGVADPDAVRQAHASAVAEVRRRAEEAPTSSLRAVYERRVGELDKARDQILQPAAGPPTVLSPTPSPRSPLSATQVRDLPIREPAPSGDGLAVHDTMRNYPRARVTAAGAYLGENPASRLGIEPGRVLAERYEVRGLLGAGRMGAVYAAFDRVREEDVAVKVLLPHLLADPKAHERFINEAKFASDLAHDGIVPVYDLHETTGLTFLTMELLPGRSLRDEILESKESGRRLGADEVRVGIPADSGKSIGKEGQARMALS